MLPPTASVTATSNQGPWPPSRETNGTTRQRNMTLIEEKTTDLEQNAKLAHAKVHELYEIANKTISSLDGRVAAIEAVGRD